MSKKNNSLILIGVLVAISVIALIAMQFMKPNGDYVRILVGGDVYGTYPISRNQTIRIDLGDGEYNIVKIENGTCDMIESTCYNQICVNDLPIDKDSLIPIVCLPHEVIVEIRQAEE